jgi:hypothetical protein
VLLSESERIERTPDRTHEIVNARTEKGFSSPAYTTNWRQWNSETSLRFDKNLILR